MQDEIDDLVTMYEQRTISRRALVQGLASLVLAERIFGETAAGTEPPAPARTLNHVTILTPDVRRSKAFYQRLTGLAIRDEGKDFCEFRFDGGFLGIYAPEEGRRPGFDHFCFGIENYDAKRVLSRLQQAVPQAHPTLENADQVYVRDPDGVRVQFADVNYKS